MKQEFDQTHEEEELDLNLGSKAVIFGSSALVTMGLPLLLHAPLPAEIAGLVGAVVLVANSPKIYAEMRDHLPMPITNIVERMQERKRARGESREWNEWDRFWGRHLDGSVKPQRPQNAAPPQSVPAEKEQKGQMVGAWVPPQFRLEDVLSVIHAFNAKGCVYFGESEGGSVAVHLHDMYHVMDVSSSGKGKSNRFRLAMMQLVNTCATYYINPLAASVKSVKDAREIEVWQPIYDRLANKGPVKKGPDIFTLMNTLVEEIMTRNEQEERRDFSWQHKPIFVFIDELPEVFARCPEAIELLDKLGRMGRQYCVFCWVASQTANVKDIGLSTAAQAQFMTRIYGGGDKTSADRLMKGSLPKDTERILQTNKEGLTIMLATGLDGSAFTRAPLVTNEAMFAYLTLPDFKKADWLIQPPSEKATRLLDESEQEKEGLLPFYPFTPSPKIGQKAENIDEMQGKRVKGKRVKGQYDDQILEAMDALQDEQRPLTLNAIARYAGLTRHQYDDIEEVAVYYGYDLERGKGRPKEA